MIRSVEASGTNIEAAVANAMKELVIDVDMLDVEKVVLENPRSGFLGIGSSPAKVRVSYKVSRADKAVDFLEGLLERMGSIAQPSVVESNDENIELRIDGQELGMLIGRRGETLNAIQHITNFVVNKDEEERVRVIVDVENYRKKREESLIKLAEKTASKVMRYKRNIALEPMNSYERHVIHSALQDWKDVSTFSSGSDPRRCVVVSYTPNGEKPPKGNRSRKG